MSGGVAGVYRVTGIAHDADGDCPWSLIFKIIGMTDGRRDPAGPLYWKREFLAYQSRLLETLPGRVRAARCYGTVELSDSLISLGLRKLLMLLALAG
jgi:hypothetical protein